MTIELDILQTLAVAALVLYLGRYIKHFLPVLERLCIPDPVVGGILFSILRLIGQTTGLCMLELDTTLQSVFMTVFFTAVGFTCDASILKKFGKRTIQFTIVLIILVVCQNLIGVGFTKVFGIHPLLGLCTGSASMTGGHGTAGSFAPIFEETFGCEGAVVVGLAAATFGLVSGGLIGGPVGNLIVKIYHLEDEAAARQAMSSESDESGKEIALSAKNFVLGANEIILSMGIGTIIYILLKKVGITFPSYVGGMVMGAVLRNMASSSKKFETPLAEIDCIGNLSLSYFEPNRRPAAIACRLYRR